MDLIASWRSFVIALCRHCARMPIGQGAGTLLLGAPSRGGDRFSLPYGYVRGRLHVAVGTRLAALGAMGVRVVSDLYRGLLNDREVIVSGDGTTCYRPFSGYSGLFAAGICWSVAAVRGSGACKLASNLRRSSSGVPGSAV